MRARVDISLLGRPFLRLSDDVPKPLDKRSASLLAYVALEGNTGRDRLAGLLYPQTSNAAARNNLSQVIKRLRSLSNGHPLLDGKLYLSLAEGVVVDVLGLLRTHQTNDLVTVANTSCDLLADLDFADCPEFALWLASQRKQLHHIRCHALASLAEQASASGQPRVALGHLKMLVTIDPLDEEWHRQLMQTYARMGNLAAAEAAYEQCRTRMLEELGVMPSVETRDLHREIQRASLNRPAAPLVLLQSRPPHSLIFPPAFVGRREELASMQAAWQQNQAIFVTGDAGVGKTRLMQEFLANKGRYYLFEGLPDDPGTPYATYSRTLRQALRAFPGLRLPDWVVAEAARLLPELGGGPLPVGERDRLRFFHAIAEANELTVRAGMRTVVVDDLHLVDPASLELGHFVYARQWGRRDGMKSLMLARVDEMAPEGRQAMAWVVDRGYGIEVKLQPLTEAETAELLAGIDPAWRDWATPLYHHTGGNPGMILETLKTLNARDQLKQGLPEALPVPESFAARVERRLTRLSPEALQLARLAALSERGLDVARAADLLACPPVALLSPWAELDAAGILRDGRPVHGLMRQVLLAGIPEALRRHLLDQIVGM